MSDGRGLTEAQKDHRRPEVYPLLPDWENGLDDMADAPHPDGRPWRKACKVCAFRTNDPQDLGEAYQRAVLAASDETLFYCVHRHDEGFHRICACFAAFRASPNRPVVPEERSDGEG